MESDAKYSEDQLVSQLNAGNKTAFSILYVKYSAKLFNFTKSILYDKSLAEDITQNCFLKIWERRESLDPQKSFSAYIFTIARNLVYKETERLILDNKFLEHEKTNTSEITNDTLEYINASFLEAHIETLIDNLPSARKLIFRMKRKDKLSNKEIAEQLNISEKTVETQIYRSLNYLKEKLKDYMLLFLL